MTNQTNDLLKNILDGIERIELSLEKSKNDKDKMLNEVLTKQKSIENHETPSSLIEVQAAVNSSISRMNVSYLSLTEELGKDVREIKQKLITLKQL